jgi:hypothetical protein
MELKGELIPDEVFATFNALIAQNIMHGRATVKQGDVVTRLVDGGLNRSEIYARHWLDVEDSYREAGWKVEYDKPGYNETYEPFFVFSAKG